MSPHKWFDWWHLYLIVFTNHIARQINTKPTMTLRADIGPMIDGLVRVLMQCTMMAIMSGLRTAQFGMFAAGFLSVDGGLEEVRDVLGGRCNFA